MLETLLPAAPADVISTFTTYWDANDQMWSNVPDFAELCDLLHVSMIEGCTSCFRDRQWPSRQSASGGAGAGGSGQPEHDWSVSGADVGIMNSCSASAAALPPLGQHSWSALGGNCAGRSVSGAVVGSGQHGRSVSGADVGNMNSSSASAAAAADPPLGRTCITEPKVQAFPSTMHMPALSLQTNENLYAGKQSLNNATSTSLEVPLLSDTLKSVINQDTPPKPDDFLFDSSILYLCYWVQNYNIPVHCIHCGKAESLLETGLWTHNSVCRGHTLHDVEEAMLPETVEDDDDEDQASSNAARLCNTKAASVDCHDLLPQVIDQLPDVIKMELLFPADAF
eukprot:3940297-Rhodomonas_salina.3